MSDEPTRLEPDILAVLRSAEPTEVEASAKARILQGIDARVLALTAGAAGLGQVGHAAPAAKAGLGAWMASKPLALALVFAAGGAAGALLRGAAESRVVYVDRPVSTVAVATPAPLATASPNVVVVDALPDEIAAPVHEIAAPLDSGAALAAESALLDVARTALARGEPDHALAAIARHAAQFPHGVLREEREALAVKALVRAGRGSEARARADRFRAHYPQSLFSTAIDSSIDSVREMDSTAPKQP